MRIVAGSEGAGASPEGSRKLTLTREEWDLVWALRDAAAGPLKDTLWRLLRDIVAFVSQPACAEAQPDGVPCSTVSRDCAECRRLEACLAVLHETVNFR